MTNEIIYSKPFYISYYSNKDSKHIVRRGKEDEKTRRGITKQGQLFFVYFDLDKNNYRCATGSWKVRSM